MNRWIAILLGLSLVAIGALTMAWQYYVKAPARAQAEFVQLIEDVDPLVKRHRTHKPAVNLQSVGALLGTPQADKTGILVPKSPARTMAARTLEASGRAHTDETVFDVYRTALLEHEQRFTAVEPSYLSPCQRDEFYRYWGSLRHWSAWVNTEMTRESNPDDIFAGYEAQVNRYTGRPVRFEEIKAIGEVEFEAVTEQLSQLTARVQADYGMDLDAFALRDKNFSTSEDAITARLAPLLAEIEQRFEEGGHFDFAPVPKGVIQTRKGYGPNFAIASYRRQDDAMIIYWADGAYNHIYDTMLAVHEIMPGHHQQIKMKKSRACGQGPINAPTSFLEGWATYAESLADELGMFDAPDQRLGWLDYKLVRAMRIKLDVKRLEDGLTEAQALAFWTEAMPKRLHADFGREWARVSKSPHHLSYIFGARAISDAKETLRAKLGDGFSEKEFHAAMLNSPHKNLLFLAQRTEAQMQARKALISAAPETEETSL